MYGWLFSYRYRRILGKLLQYPMPPFAVDIIDTVRKTIKKELDLNLDVPDMLLCNEYLPGQVRIQQTANDLCAHWLFRVSCHTMTRLLYLVMKYGLYHWEVHASCNLVVIVQIRANSFIAILCYVRSLMLKNIIKFMNLV